MTGTLINLPLRAGVSGMRLAFRVTEEIADRALTITVRVVETLRSSDDSPAPSSAGISDEGEEAAVPSRQAPRSEAASHMGAVQEPAAPERPTPSHVSEEPVLVEEVAEAGAEDGAGASVTVDEPWSGYTSMNANEVISRLKSATPAELAAVKLYESGKRRRATVLDAVDRQLRIAQAAPRR